MAAENRSQERTTIGVTRGVLSRLEDAKPYDSMSYNDLLTDMADVYEQERNL